MSRNYLVYLICIFSAILWFLMLGYRDLIDPDEGRYAEIPREMVVTGDWVTPRLYGLKYFEKPPLQYWATALLYKVFGANNVTARLWTTLAGFLCAIWVAYISYRLYGKNAAYFAYLSTLSTLLICGCAHYLTLDITLTLFTTLGLGSFILAQRQRNTLSNLVWMLIGWVALAGAVLSKGLIGVLLPGAAVFIYMVWQRDWAIIRQLHLIKGLALFLLISVPWFVLVSIHNAEFLRFFFIHEHFERYTTDVHERTRPIYFFVLVFALGVFPWLTLSVKSLFTPDFSWKRDSGREFNAERFMWIFIVFVIIFFSLGNSKLATYILPVFPILSILNSKKSSRLEGYIGEFWSMFVAGVLLFAAGLLLPNLTDDAVSKMEYAAYQNWVAFSGMLLVAGGLAVFLCKNYSKIAIASCAFSSILAFQLLLWGFQTVSTSRSLKTIADEIMALKIAKDTPIFLVANNNPSLPFYLNRSVTLAAYSGELAMGLKAEPQKAVANPSEFIHRWNAAEKAVAVLDRKHYEIYKNAGVEAEVVFEGSKDIVIRTRPDNAITGG